MLAANLSSQKGSSSIEVIPMIIIFSIILNFSFGFFGVIHSGILNNIAARNYVNEVFNHRTYLFYHRDSADVTQADDKLYFYQKDYNRFSGIKGENDGDNNTDWIATTRGIDFFNTQAEVQKPSGEIRMQASVLDGARYQKQGTNPVWIMVRYGICLRPDCGDK